MPIIVAGQLHSFAVYNDASLVNSVGVTSDCRTKIRPEVLIVGILGNVVVTQNHIAQCATPVGNHNRNNARTKVC